MSFWSKWVWLIICNRNSLNWVMCKYIAISFTNYYFVFAIFSWRIQKMFAISIDSTKICRNNNLICSYRSHYTKPESALSVYWNVRWIWRLEIFPCVKATYPMQYGPYFIHNIRIPSFRLNSGASFVPIVNMRWTYLLKKIHNGSISFLHCYYDQTNYYN